MAVTAVLSPKEMERVAGLAYEGQTIRVSLAYDPGNQLTSTSTVTECDALKITTGGYADFTDTIATGSFNATLGRYEMPYLDAVFTATGSGYTYNTMYVVIGSEVWLHSILVENPSVIMVAGQTQTYRVVFVTDD